MQINEEEDYDPAPRTMLAYDGELIDGADAITRYRRDEQLEQKYEEAEAALDAEQLTWDGVAKRLQQSLYK